jgi:hypothetical protein
MKKRFNSWLSWVLSLWVLAICSVSTGWAVEPQGGGAIQGGFRMGR